MRQSRFAPEDETGSRRVEAVEPVVSLGGAYAVLPYVCQGAVDHYHWLSGLQMIDGLALGETTPGPMVCAVRNGSSRVLALAGRASY